MLVRTGRQTTERVRSTSCVTHINTEQHNTDSFNKMKRVTTLVKHQFLNNVCVAIYWAKRTILDDSKGLCV
jgi:hypothetical protein